MSTREFLQSLAERGIDLFLVGERLRYRAPGQALTKELWGQIHERRAALIEFLQTGSVGHVGTSGRSPLSHGQAALWFLYQLVRGSTAYN